MTRFIDRRSNNKNKSAVNRQRFLHRYKAQIKEAVRDAIGNRKITDFENSGKVNLPTRDILEPFFHFGQGGKRNVILPGNKNFVSGDKLPKNSSSINPNMNSGDNTLEEGKDDFSFHISREEFLDLFFDELELPNLIKTQFTTVNTNKYIRSGFTTHGIPANINIVRSIKSAIGRKIASKSAINKRIENIKKEILFLKNSEEVDNDNVIKLENEIKKMEKRLKNIAFIDPFDLRYNNRVRHPSPTTQAVMFCLMDVSGSMDEMKKNLAKRFFILLYLFLTRNYESIELVFIRHHTAAKEVNEQEFFYSKETGGTVVSSALELMRDIIVHRYPASQWNIYVAQASDGDNWNNDSPKCRDILIHDIMPFVQYFAYVEIRPRSHQSLWKNYLIVNETSKNFAMQEIDQPNDIYPVLKKLFKRQNTTTSQQG